jgi:hypothetical protein
MDSGMVITGVVLTPQDFHARSPNRSPNYHLEKVEAVAKRAGAWLLSLHVAIGLNTTTLPV